MGPNRSRLGAILMILSILKFIPIPFEVRLHYNLHALLCAWNNIINKCTINAMIDETEENAVLYRLSISPKI